MAHAGGVSDEMHVRKSRVSKFKSAAKKVGMVAAGLGADHWRKKKVIRKVFAIMDADSNANLDFEELLAICGDHDGNDTEHSNDADVRKFFDMLDENSSGLIDGEEMVHALRTSDEALALAKSFEGLRKLFDGGHEDYHKSGKKKRAPSKRRRASMSRHNTTKLPGTCGRRRGKSRRRGSASSIELTGAGDDDAAGAGGGFQQRKAAAPDGEEAAADYGDHMAATEQRISMRKRKARTSWRVGAIKSREWNKGEQLRLAAAAELISAQQHGAQNRVKDKFAAKHAKVRQHWKDAARKGVKKQLAARKLKEAQMAALQRGSKRKQGSGRQKKKVKRKQSKIYE